MPTPASLVADDPGLLPYLKRVAKQGREQADVKVWEVGAAARKNPSQIYRFEDPSEDVWQNETDRVINGYAAALGVPPSDLWERAVQMWRDGEAGGGEPTDPPPPAGPPPGELSRGRPVGEPTRTGRPATSRRRAPSVPRDA